MQMFIHRGRDSLFAKRRAVVGAQDGTLALENDNYRNVEDVENHNVSFMVPGQKQELPDKDGLPESFQLQDLKELPDDASPKIV